MTKVYVIGHLVDRNFVEIFIVLHVDLSNVLLRLGDSSVLSWDSLSIVNKSTCVSVCHCCNLGRTVLLLAVLFSISYVRSSHIFY